MRWDEHGPKRKPDRRTRVALGIPDWPAEDRLKWEAACQPRDPFEDNADPISTHRPATRARFSWAYGRWLAFLTQAEPDLLAHDSAERVTAERIKGFSEELAETNRPASIAIALRHLRGALQLIAPALDTRWLLRTASLIERLGRPTNRRHQLQTADETYLLGFELMDRALASLPSDQATPFDAALRYRDGLIIALLSVAPLRRRNLAEIIVGRHLVAVGDSWTVLLTEETTKGHAPLEYPLPARLTPYIDHYLQQIRSTFPGADSHAFLWASKGGRQLGAGAIYEAVCRRTKQAFGQPMHLHLFRAAAGTLLALRDPENVLAVKDLLGHTKFDTAQSFYIKASTIAAGRTLAAILSRTRGS